MSPVPPTLFCPSLLIPNTTSSLPNVQSQLPSDYIIRPLSTSDFHKGFYDCLAGLTIVGKTSEESFSEVFTKLQQTNQVHGGGGGVYHIVVIEDLVRGLIVATGTLVVEQKFLRSGAKAGHVEDIVVRDSERGKKLGIRLIEQLKVLAENVGCYKMLLTCSETNQAFYEKSGFVQKDMHMALYL